MDDSSHMATIIRDCCGRLIAAVKLVSLSKHFVKCLLQISHELHLYKVCKKCLKTSHPDFSLLGREAEVD